MQKRQIFVLSVLSGVFLSIPWLVCGLSWTLFFAFLPLLIAEDLIVRQNKGQISIFFLPSLLTFLLWNLLSTWWIAHVSVIGMLLIVLLNSLIMAIVWWSKHLVGRKFGHSSSVFSLIVFWIAFEFINHNWSIPWPWLSLGNGFANSVQIIQWYEFTGVLGGSLWILIANLLIFSVVKNGMSRSIFSANLKQAVFAIFSIVVPIIVSFYLYESIREKGKPVEVLILQPNINPYTEKFTVSSEVQINKIMSLAESGVIKSTDLIVAPETSWPVLWEDSLFTQNHSLLPLKNFMQLFPEVNFIVGAITQRKFESHEAISETAQYSKSGNFCFDVYNSALMIDQNLNVQIGHKSILVNGVERMPFQRYFSFLKKYLIDLGGTNTSMATATQPALFSGKDSLMIGPVICFESVFGEYCSRMVNRGANLLVVITNDGWWKESAGNWQHFGYSRLRAIETRRAIVQSANTGISGFINQRGEVVSKTGLNSYEALRSTVHLNNEPTFYVRNGDLIGRISLVLSGLILFYLLMYGRFKKGKKNPH